MKTSRPPNREEPHAYNEWLETLSRIKADQLRRYAREVSAGTQVQVERYERLRERHGRRLAA